MIMVPEEMMRQIWITKHGPPEVLALREAATPSLVQARF